MDVDFDPKGNIMGEWSRIRIRDVRPFVAWSEE